ncbi:MAG: hypothetical protein U0872_08705 [Planctomycetaceae bacterium]
MFIKPYDLEGFTERYNPLLTGARTLIGYWHEHDRTAGPTDLDGEPYVLLIVRPSGIVAYYVAMKMLSTLKQPFGYELVDDSITLQPPPLDEMAQAQCRMAIEQQLAERGGVAGSGRGSGGGAGGGRGGGKAGVAARSWKRSRSPISLTAKRPWRTELGELRPASRDAKNKQSATPGARAPGRVLPAQVTTGTDRPLGRRSGHRASTEICVTVRNWLQRKRMWWDRREFGDRSGPSAPPGGSPGRRAVGRGEDRHPGAGVAASEGEGQSGEPPEESPINLTQNLVRRARRQRHRGKGRSS